MIKNNKGFAVTGIMYAILILFLMLLLLILANFQSRKILFDKQKNNVYEKLNGLELTDYFLYSASLQEFIVPKDGTYLIEVWGSDNGSSKGSYVKGKINLYQGIKLFITVGRSGSSSSVRTEKIKTNTVILSAKGASEGNNYGYYNTSENSDITIGKLKDYVEVTSNIPSKTGTDGYVKISYIGDML